MDNRYRLNHYHYPHRHGGWEDRISADSLPLIDTRLLSQSELLSLCLCSSLSSSSSSSASLASSAGGDDDLTPKIDRSVFNESAGSRKQTFLRLRLARHPPSPKPPSPERRLDESSCEENLQIVSLLRSLFCIDSFPGKRKEDEEVVEDEHEDNEGQRLFPVPVHFFSNVYPNLNLDSVQSVLVQVVSRNERGRKRGRPRKTRNPSDRPIDSERSEAIEVLDFANREGAFASSAALGTKEAAPFPEELGSNLGTETETGLSGFFSDQNSNARTLQAKRKRGRPPKNRDSSDRVNVSWKIEDKEVLDLHNRDGEVVDLSELANAEDLYGEELRKRTMGLETKEELLGFLGQLRGEWVNTGKKKKIVEASDFGGMLPRGWKILICIKKKAGNLWLSCRRYVSPNGRQFASCKEVSTYLLSLLEVQGNNRINTTQFDDNLLVRVGVIHANSSNCDSVESIPLPDLAVSGTDIKEQPQKSGSPSNRMFEHGKCEEKDVPDSMNGESTVEGSVTRDSLIADLVNMDDATANLVDRANTAADLEDRVGHTKDLLNRDSTTTVDSAKREDTTMIDMASRDCMAMDFLNRDNNMVDLVNGDNAMADLAALSNSEVLYGEKLRKMTQGMATTEELLEFWSS